MEPLFPAVFLCEMLSEKTCAFQFILLLGIYDPSNLTHDNCYFSGRIFNFEQDLNFPSHFGGGTETAEEESHTLHV